ncbi:murein biosynthesis integral membrane protein MurJ [Thermanaerosceptrum fracticalcis]|uniref:Probable lipid II flippase MurJ n=1 Tax=Thermanaerosceptrum fracticalcis TaxID=1712410 RepID=A0A7G6E4T7_THEFR|nr:murein biosynthesis integral membrane protein MurJ [Thermanaerosceptrum fracticalcis]QNB47091.1 murein biosynthesis integral membrane protein MurJ [Thermanaerosceptrum fracticalcis]
MDNKKVGTVAKATLVIAVITVLSKILGFAREAVIAQQFGANSVTDAFLVVFNIPYMFNGILSSALVVVVVPIFLEYMARGQVPEARKIFTTVFVVAVFIMGIIVLMGITYSEYVIRLFAPGFNESTLELASVLAILIFPTILFFTITNFLMGVLNASNIFAPPAMAPVILNIAVIGAVFTLGRNYGIYGAALGMLVGTAMGALFQIIFIKKTSFRFIGLISIRDESVKKVFRLMLPVLIGSGVGQLNVLIYYFFGSGLNEGSISALNYATKLILLPQGIFVMAVGTAIFPSLSRAVAFKEMGRFTGTLARGAKMVFLFTAPAVMGLMILRHPIVELLFKRGAFDERAVYLTTGALLLLSVGLIGQCLGPVITRGFYALQDTVTPVKVTVVTVAINLGLSVLLVKSGQHLGLALANSIASTVNALLLVAILGRRVKGIINKELLIFASKVVAASLIMGLAVSGMDAILVKTLTGSKILLALRVGIDIFIGLIVYLLTGFITRIDEFSYLLDITKVIANKGKVALRTGT